MAPQLVFLIFSLIVLAAGLWKPNATRVFTGFFFLAMALGVNLSMLLTNPGSYPQAGAQALVPLYRWFFTTVLAAYTIPLVIALILVEVSIAGLILSRGKWARYGLIIASVFCVVLAPLGMKSISTPALGLAIALLLRKSYDRSILDMLKITRVRTANQVG